MQSSVIALKPLLRKQLAEFTIEKLKVGLAIKPLQYLYGSGHDKKLELMRKMPRGTIGYDIAQMLDREGLKLIPKYENHDLKHLLLGYGMTSTEEIRMQAFLLGNGNYSFSCILFLLSGVLLPSEWRTFYQDYKKGRKSKCVLHLSIDQCMHMTTSKLRTDLSHGN